MPSAHYRPLEKSLPAFHDQDDYNDDEDEDSEYEHVDGQQLNNNNHYNTSQHYHIHPHAQHTQQAGCYAPTITMASSRLSRPATAGLRRYGLILLLCLVFVTVVYCLLTADTRLGAGTEDADTDFGLHTGTDRRHKSGTENHKPLKSFKSLKLKSQVSFMSHSTNNHVLNETLHICSESHEDRRLYMQDKPRNDYAQLPVIYFVTPTYPRREQIPELTRLAHTLLHVPRLHWLVANDHDNCNTFLGTLLNRFGIPYTHMASPMPSKFRTHKPAPRGVANRRAALQWLHQHNITNGVLYFGDDDNTYDLKLFTEIRDTQRVSMFPVGLIADYAVSGPVVRKGKVIAFLDSWVADRRWPVDMAGFAVNLSYMAQYPNVNMPYKPGYEEDLFLRSIGLRLDQIEPRGNNCTEILVWHTQTKNKKAPVVRLSNDYMDERSNLGALFRALNFMGVARASDSEGLNAQISKNGKVKPHSYFLS